MNVTCLLYVTCAHSALKCADGHNSGCGHGEASSVTIMGCMNGEDFSSSVLPVAFSLNINTHKDIFLGVQGIQAAYGTAVIRPGVHSSLLIDGARAV